MSTGTFLTGALISYECRHAPTRRFEPLDMVMRSTSSSSSVAWGLRASEAMSRLRAHLRTRKTPLDIPAWEAMVSEYTAAAERYLGKPLSACKVVEIGYGATPWRLCWLHGRGRRADR
jgi:hypothetical protein